MWWLIGSAPNFCVDPDALQDHCVIMEKTQCREGNLPLRQKKIFKKIVHPERADYIDFVKTILCKTYIIKFKIY